MKYIHCDTYEFLNRIKNKDVVLFGAGQNLRTMEIRKLDGLSERIIAVIDNGDAREIDAFGRRLPVYKPEYLKSLTGEVAVVITTCIYCKEMAEQLLEMGLPDTVELYFYSMMSALEENPLTDEERAYLFDASRPTKIPKVIHGFWFSGEEKPDSYKKCFDSWSKMCPDYEIKEWNKNNYDYGKHPFVKKAVEVGAWAAATDFARMDVISEYGGIYMDMDVEVLKPLDDILGHRGIFTFYSDCIVDPAAFAAEPNNKIVNTMLKLFDDVEVPRSKEDFTNYYSNYFLPLYMSAGIVKYGVDMNGRFQNIDDNLFLPRHLMMPLDCMVYEVKTDADSFMIHRSNVGWKEDDYVTSKSGRNRQIIEKLSEGAISFAG